MFVRQDVRHNFQRRDRIIPAKRFADQMAAPPNHSKTVPDIFRFHGGHREELSDGLGGFVLPSGFGRSAFLRIPFLRTLAENIDFLPDRFRWHVRLRSDDGWRIVGLSRSRERAAKRDQYDREHADPRDARAHDRVQPESK